MNVVTCDKCKHLERTEVKVELVKPKYECDSTTWINLTTCDFIIEPKSGCNDILDAHCLRICDHYEPK